MSVAPTPDMPPNSVARMRARAERNPGRVLRWARRYYERYGQSAEPLGRAWASYMYGWALLRTDRRVLARDYLQAAADMFTEQGALLGRLYSRHGLLTAVTFADDESIAGLQELEGEYQALGRIHERVRTRLDWIAQFNMREQAPLVLQQQPTVQVLLDEHGTLADRARWLRSQGIAYTTLGLFPEALDCLSRAGRLYEQAHLLVDAAMCWFERAWMHQRCEQLEEARLDLERAKRVFERYDVPSYDALCTKDLGLIASREGRFDRALAYTIEARANFLQLGRINGALFCDLNLVTVAYYSGLYSLALKAYEQIARVCAERQLWTRHFQVRRNSAMVLRAQRHFATALTLLSELEVEVARLHDLQELADIRQVQAEVLRDMGRWSEAAQQFVAVGEQLAALGNFVDAAKCRRDAGWVLLSQQQPNLPGAEQYLQSVGQLLDDQPMERWPLQYGLGRCAALHGQAQQALAYFLEASRTVSTLRARLASEHASSGLFAQAQELYHDALQLAADLAKPEDVLELAEQQRALALRYQVMQASFSPQSVQVASYAPASVAGDRASEADTVLLDEFSTLLRNARHITTIVDNEPPSERVDFTWLRNQFDIAYPSGWLVLTVLPNRDELLLVCWGSDTASTLERVPLDDSLRDLLERACSPRYRKSIYRGLEPNGAAAWATFDQLGALLIPPSVRAQLRPDRRLLIVPSGLFHALSWAALRVDGAWLCQQAIIQQLPSLTLWPGLAARQWPGAAACLIGCGEFGGRAVALPNAIRSLDVVQQCWPHVELRLENAQATRAAIRTLAETGALQRYGVLHITSHAELDSTAGQLAHVKLFDTDLLLDEVAALRLDGALVVLAACKGAASEVLPGDEVLSLSRGFLAAGARDVVASLWQMFDNTVPDVLQMFYERLHDGHDVPTALTLAQRELIERYAQQPSIACTPLVWASLCTIGVGTSL